MGTKEVNQLERECMSSPLLRTKHSLMRQKVRLLKLRTCSSLFWKIHLIIYASSNINSDKSGTNINNHFIMPISLWIHFGKKNPDFTILAENLQWKEYRP